ncbi:polyprenyl synthetase family protein [Streptomyces sp. NPDC005962]|uniref:polyprenyl synthetase family protein n=1 Tax=Streptomyces sp. NPDC005962 TaxID=3154466 RepID=UPI0033F61B06
MSADIASPTRSRALTSPDTARTTVAPFIEKNVSAMEPTQARICGYHFDFIDESGELSRTDTGKLTRASIMMAVADGFGIRPEDVRVQAAVKSPHNAALLHDAIADSDDLRRGQPGGRHSA